MFSSIDRSTGTLPMRSSPYELERTDMYPGTYGPFANSFQYCGHCGCWHQGACPRIKTIEYYPNGTIKKIEYHSSSYSVNIDGI